MRSFDVKPCWLRGERKPATIVMSIIHIVRKTQTILCYLLLFTTFYSTSEKKITKEKLQRARSNFEKW